MILITDGGSTKCDWILLDDTGNVSFRTTTEGLNPSVFPREEILYRIQSNEELQSVFNTVKTVDFYGAGCGTISPRKLLSEVLSLLFVNAKVTVQEDIMAAVYSVTTEPAIVCILGTGSNSCYFDGESIKTNVDALGYVLMDEASGNYFGKQLIRDYFYKKMPSDLSSKFEKQYNLSSDVIKMNLYKMPNPNTYLASFAKFLFSDQDENDYFFKLLNRGISKFINNHILSYPEAKLVPIHFVGSIAYFSEAIIRDCLEQHNLEFGKIIKSPIDGLIKHYITNKLKTL